MVFGRHLPNVSKVVSLLLIFNSFMTGGPYHKEASTLISAHQERAKSLIYGSFNIFFLVFSECLSPNPALSPNVINPFQGYVPFLYHLKTSENLQLQKWETGVECVNFDLSKLFHLFPVLFILTYYTYFLYETWYWRYHAKVCPFSFMCSDKTGMHSTFHCFPRHLCNIYNFIIWQLLVTSEIDLVHLKSQL